MLKHMLTSECPRKCTYCVVKNINRNQTRNLNKVSDMYEAFRLRGHDSIMLTGGEPTRAEDFDDLYRMARVNLSHVHITTQNQKLIITEAGDRYNSIIFSLHDDTYKALKVVTTACLYASVLDFQFHALMGPTLARRGWKGLTVNEDQRGKDVFKWPGGFKKFMDKRYPDFSLRINRKGNCMDEWVLLPDLDVTKDFSEYL